MLPLLLPPSAAAQPLTDPPLRTGPSFTGNVIPALTIPQYLSKIEYAAPKAWDEIENNLDYGRYRLQSDLLVLPPFDDVRQAAFYLPWVVLQQDEEAALQCQNAYLQFKDAIMYFDDRLVAAGRAQADAQQVADAYAAVRLALERFLQTVPPGLS